LKEQNLAILEAANFAKLIIQSSQLDSDISGFWGFKRFAGAQTFCSIPKLFC